MSKERSSLTFILKLDAHARKFITVHSLNNGGKNIITKTFNILEGSLAYSRYPVRANFPYISLENSSNRYFELCNMMWYKQQAVRGVV